MKSERDFAYMLEATSCRIAIYILFTQLSPQAGWLPSFLASATSCDVAIDNGREISFPQSRVG